MICIGYAGCEAFDLILYTGRILSKLNYKVLIIDLSNSGALQTSINHGMELDSSKDIVSYRDISYLRRVPTGMEMEEFQAGVIFVDFGMNYVTDFPIELHQMNLVVNTFPHMIEAVKELLKEVISYTGKCSLLIRDARTIDDIDFVVDTMKLPDKFYRISYLYHDISDYESAVDCQISKVIRFTKISSRMKKCIIQQIKDMFPQLKSDRISKAMIAAKWGA